MTSKKQKKLKTRNRVIILFILIPVLVILAVSLSVYFFYFNRDNFSDREKTYISVDKDMVIPGQKLTYRVQYTNSGRRDVGDLKVTIDLPEGTTLFSIANPESRPVLDRQKEKITVDAGDLGPGDTGWIEFGVVVDIPQDDGTVIESGDVSFEYLSGDKPIRQTLGQKVLTEIDSAPELSGLDIEMEDLNGFVAETGDTVRFVINLKNTGTMDAEGVDLYNQVPEDIEVIEASITGSGLYNPFNNTIDWQINTLEAGGEFVAEYEAVLTKSFSNLESFTNKVTATSGDKRLEASHTGRVLAHEDLSTSEVIVEDVNGGKAWAWDRLRYTVTIKNTGKRTARDFKLICPIPQGTGYIEGSATGDNHFFDEDDSILQWNLTGLEAGEVMDVSFDVNVAGYLTGGGYIEDSFKLLTKREETVLETKGIEINPYVFQTIVIMGDSHVSLNDWPETLAALLEITYPHAVFNIIESAVPGEMAVDAIERFDESVRVHNPDIIILGYGTNDAGAQTGFYRYHMGILTQQALSTGAEVLVYNIAFIDITGVWSGKANYRVFNQILEEDIAGDDDITYIDLYSSFTQDPDRYIKDDGMHWSEDGEDLAAGIIFKALFDILDEDGRIKD